MNKKTNVVSQPSRVVPGARSMKVFAGQVSVGRCQHSCLAELAPTPKRRVHYLTMRFMGFKGALFTFILTCGVLAAATQRGISSSIAVGQANINQHRASHVSTKTGQASRRSSLTAGRAQRESINGYRNVAWWREPGVRIVVSSHSFRVGGMTAEGSVCPLNRPFTPGEPASHAWISSHYQHLPQWVWIHFDGPRRINEVVLYAVSMATSPVEFSGEYLLKRSDEFSTIFHVQHARFDRRTLRYAVHFKPVVTNNFRLVIERTTASVTPQSWVAELAQLEVYGVNAVQRAETSTIAHAKVVPANLNSGLLPTKFAPEVRDVGHALIISTPWYHVALDKFCPRILSLSWDSLGQGELGVDLLRKSGAGPVLDPIFHNPMPLGNAVLTRTGNVFHYAPIEVAPGAFEQVSIRVNERGFYIGLAAVANRTMMMRGGLFRFHFAANQTPTTFVCHPSKVMNYVATPAYLAAPDFGTVYVTSTGDPAAFYRKPAALFLAKTYWVDITPHQPDGEDGLNEIGSKPWHVTMHFAIKRLEPMPWLVNKSPLLKRLPKYSLNMVQWRPDTGILSNSVMSIDCGLAILFYAQEALFAPHLRDRISPMELVRASVNRYFQGAPGYEMPNRNVFAPDWWSSRETPAYLVISAWYVIRTIGGMKQVRCWLKPMEAVADHIEEDFGADGLIYYHGRGTLWFDTYAIHGADAYSNAADYRAFKCMADVERLAGHPGRARRYDNDARRIKRAYFKSFYDPHTGVIAGWRTRKGKLHDYMFPWVNGFAIYQGLVPRQTARQILQRLLAKLKSIGFHSYELGLPTNLIPISPTDYKPHTSGAPTQPNGMDTWQEYMNGGATPALEYYFIQALYRTGQYQAAEHLLWPLIGSYERGTFNAGVKLRGEKQRNPVGSAFYLWNGSHGRGEGYLPEDWDGIEAIFTGHYGIGFNRNGYYLEPWSPLKGKIVKLDLPYMGNNVQDISH